MNDAAPKGPRRLGRYVLLEPLPAVGMVQPWLARLDGEVELSVLEHLHPDVAEHPSAQGRFRRRAEIASHLDHPNIVHTRGTVEANGMFCVVTELIFGVSLERVLDELRVADRTMPLPIFGAIATRILRALVHAHGATDRQQRLLGVVHRHLAPRSVLLGFAGEVKLGDFTLALADVGGFRTAPGTGVGPIAYMSPEQVRGQPLDARSDLYSVSALLHELLGGARLVAEGAMIDMLRSVAEEPAASLKARRAGLPAELIEVIERGLHKDPTLRWPSALRYLAALEAAVTETADRDALSAFVRELLPGEEQEALERLSRIRTAAASVEASPPAPTAPGLDLDEPFDDDDDAPAEPSVMTMPGVAAAPHPEAMPLAPRPASRVPAPRPGSGGPVSRPPSRGPERGRARPPDSNLSWSADGHVSPPRPSRSIYPWTIALAAAVVGVWAVTGWLVRAPDPRGSEPTVVSTPPSPAVEAEAVPPSASGPRVESTARPEPKVADRPAGRRSPSSNGRPSEASAPSGAAAASEGIASSGTAAPSEGAAPAGAAAPSEGAALAGAAAPSGARPPSEATAPKAPADRPGDRRTAADRRPSRTSTPHPAGHLAPLRAAVRSLQSDPSPRHFFEVHRRLAAEVAAAAPGAPRRRATRALEAAERAQDPSGLEEALRILEAADPLQ